MEIVVEKRQMGVAVVHLTGRLDLASASDLRHCLVAELAAGNRRLLVDLGELQFLDSSGLMALVDGFRAAHLAGGTLRLARPSAQARLVLQYTAIDQTLRPYETVEQALDGI